ncbi:MAG TPA: ubiquinol-cytochrome c reductase iron-sulfur subunit, partial [Bryobacterales bacterium]|nr:ubiquinol-cytochrome c reductase iron-sulfur subunit [Bryobacterales bacterium]
KDANGKGSEKYLVQIGICTHLGCVPLGEAGEYNGWFCPCHGSVYDTAGRIRLGPAPRNMDIPPFKYISDTKIVIG